MRSAFSLIAALLVVGVVTSPAGARSPKLERLALAPADMRAASDALLRNVDLVGVAPGWRPLQTTPDNAAPICPWQDYSGYTLTGRGEADFQPVKVGRAGFIGSSVDILATSADALGKFAVDTRAGTATCEAEALRRAFGATLKTVVARQLSSPSIGEHAAAYEFVFEQPAGTPKRIYIHIIEFVRARAVAVLSTTDFDGPGDTSTRTALARVIDKRLG